MFAAGQVLGILPVSGPQSYDEWQKAREAMQAVARIAAGELNKRVPIPGRDRNKTS